MAKEDIATIQFAGGHTSAQGLVVSKNPDGTVTVNTGTKTTQKTVTGKPVTPLE